VKTSLILLTITLTAAGCSSLGGRIDVLGLPRKTENGTTTNRNTIYERNPAASPPPASTTATPPSSP
jgi:hypothetical protein